MSGSAVARIVVLGGGFAGLEAAFYLRKRLGASAELTLVSDADQFVFKPNTIYIPFGKDPQRFVFALGPALDHGHVRFTRGAVESVDPQFKRVTTPAGVLAYDYLVVATGATTRPEELPGLAEHAHTIWTIEAMLRLRAALERTRELAKQGKKQRVAFLVPPNNKCSGPLYEIALMLDTWLRRHGARSGVDVLYATCEKGFIQAFGPRLDEVVTSEFETRGIKGLKSARARAVERSQIRFEDGSTVGFDLLITFPAHAAAVDYEALPSDERGFLRTRLDTRQVQDQPDVYAVGDAGDFPVKQAFLALLEADAAAEHISQRVLHEAPTARFEPVSMCVMEQFDKATFAQVPLRLTGDPDVPVTVREDRPELYRVGSGELWRAGKKLLGTVMPSRFRAGQPFHAGVSWATMETGLKMMSALFAD